MRHFKWLRGGGAPGRHSTTERAEVGTAETDPVALMRLAVASRRTPRTTMRHTPRRWTSRARRAAAPHRRGRARAPPRLRGPAGQGGEAPAAAEEEAAAGETSAAEAEPLQEHIALATPPCCSTTAVVPHAPLRVEQGPAGPGDCRDDAHGLAGRARGGERNPRLEHGELAVNSDPEQIPQTNIAVEAEVEEVYRRQLATTEDSELREILQRILTIRVSRDALPGAARGAAGAKESRRRGGAGPRRGPVGWTVGSLFGRKQE